MPLLVTKRMGASSGKWISGVAVIAVRGASGVISVTPHGRSGSLLFSAELFSGTAAVQMCCVTEIASWKGSAPYRRWVVFVPMVGTRVGASGGAGTL